MTRSGCQGQTSSPRPTHKMMEMKGYHRREEGNVQPRKVCPEAKWSIRKARGLRTNNKILSQRVENRLRILRGI